MLIQIIKDYAESFNHKFGIVLKAGGKGGAEAGI
jgi:hypothetical protein